MPAKIEILQNKGEHTPTILVDSERVPVQSFNFKWKVGDPIPVIELSVLVAESEVTLEGEVKINTIPVSDEVALKLYEDLRKKYEAQGLEETAKSFFLTKDKYESFSYEGALDLKEGSMVYFRKEDVLE